MESAPRESLSVLYKISMESVIIRAASCTRISPKSCGARAETGPTTRRSSSRGTSVISVS
ncbi:hypothetical protein GDO81_014779 [Engystomops pustulosus]|uniref:Uncharacterized protein n=1 Tax=Engystomops pustulosus TaxID=76066 RepID=A0AAV7AEW4_ENGPU|nr:hypothetical protein GDO81_014779 [Engystomops pustulosus]